MSKTYIKNPYLKNNIYFSAKVFVGSKSIQNGVLKIVSRDNVLDFRNGSMMGSHIRYPLRFFRILIYSQLWKVNEFEPEI